MAPTTPVQNRKVHTIESGVQVVHEEHSRRVEPRLRHGDTVVLLVVGSSGKVGAHAEVLDVDVVVVEVQRYEPSDLSDCPVLVKSTVHLCKMR